MTGPTPYAQGINDGYQRRAPDGTRWTSDGYRRGYAAGMMIAAGLFWMVA